MLRKELPEGMLAQRGYVQEFLFFSKVNPNLTQVAFVAKLQGAHTGQRFATIRIPFQVTKASAY